MSSELPTKSLYIKTYGCQMNVYDSVRMQDMMHAEGYQMVEQPEIADLVILNTCHIREKAAEKVYSELGRLRLLKEERKEQGGQMVIAVAGCVAQAEGEEMQKRQPAVDIVVGPQAYQRLPQMVLQALDAAHVANNNVALDFAVQEKFDTLPEVREAQGSSAFLTIQEGCDKFCTFCVVPYTRGAEVSRPVEALLEEARRMVDQGAQELVLLGQNVNAYHGVGPDGKRWSLAGLLQYFAIKLPIARLRYTTSHPRDMQADLIAAHRDIPQLMPYLHLPVQSGSNRILKQMNRGHTREEYLRMIEDIRKARPDLALSSDFIVGFPGETDEDFADTLALVEEVNFAQSYSFAYSARAGTPAALREDSVPEPVKKERLHALQLVLDRQKRAFNQSVEGDVLPVLLTRQGRVAGEWVGHSPYLQTVHATALDVADEAVMHRVVPVRITHGGPHALRGDIVMERPAVHMASSAQFSG